MKDKKDRTEVYAYISIAVIYILGVATGIVLAAIIDHFPKPNDLHNSNDIVETDDIHVYTIDNLHIYERNGYKTIFDTETNKKYMAIPDCGIIERN